MVSDEVFEKIKSGIDTGLWKPGERIPSERELCGVYQVSRVTVRSAISRLVGLGILRSKQGGGTYVCSRDSRNITDPTDCTGPLFSFDNADRMSMFEFRRIIECESAALAAMRITAESIKELGDINQKMESAGTDAETARYDMEFHIAIARATGNKVVEQVMESMKDTLFRMFEYNIEVLGKEGAEMHKNIIAALQVRDTDRARQLMLRHLQNTERARLQSDNG